VREGMPVQVTVGRETLLELAAFAPEEEIREVAMAHLEALRRGAEAPVYDGNGRDSALGA
jgi:hypothetical protein